MVIFKSTSFGSVTTSEKTYKHDIWVNLDGTIEKRTRNHEFTSEELNRFLNQNPEVIVVGTGQYGVVSISKKAKSRAEDHNIKIIAEETPKAIKTFNQLKEEGKKVVAAIHTTC